MYLATFAAVITHLNLFFGRILSRHVKGIANGLVTVVSWQVCSEVF